jgi:transcriptional regulator of acetoin/glycerol metabolism
MTPVTDPKAPKRTRSRLSRIGDDAMKAALLAALEAHAWHLSATAEALEMAGPSDVIRSMRRLGLHAEYEAARRDGRIKPGVRRADAS